MGMSAILTPPSIERDRKPCIAIIILKDSPHFHGQERIRNPRWNSEKEKAAEIFTFQRLIFLDGVEGGTSGGVAANSLKSIKFS